MKKEVWVSEVMKFKKRIKINIGDKFNKLIVIEFIGKNIHGHKRFKTICDCGNFTETLGSHLIQGNTKSCGCLHIQNHLKPKGVAAYKRLFTRCKKGSKRKSKIYEFHLDLDQFIKIIKQNCYYCNSVPIKYNPYLKKDGNFRDKPMTNFTIERSWVYINGIDRLNNNKGYTLENSVPCCIPCNEAKMDRSFEEFINHAKKITEFQMSKLNG